MIERERKSRDRERVKERMKKLKRKKLVCETRRRGRLASRAQEVKVDSALRAFLCDVWHEEQEMMQM